MLNKEQAPGGESELVKTKFVETRPIESQLGQAQEQYNSVWQKEYSRINKERADLMGELAKARSGALSPEEAKLVEARNQRLSDEYDEAEIAISLDSSGGYQRSQELLRTDMEALQKTDGPLADLIREKIQAAGNTEVLGQVDEKINALNKKRDSLNKRITIRTRAMDGFNATVRSPK